MYMNIIERYTTTLRRHIATRLNYLACVRVAHLSLSLPDRDSCQHLERAIETAIAPNSPLMSRVAIREVISSAFVSLYRPTGDADVPLDPIRASIIDQFHRLYYHSRSATWQNTYYRGVQTAKCPLDLWMYQEVVFEVCPDLIVETGTNRGGSASFLADLCQINDRGRVVTIDVEELPGRLAHDRITYLSGRSTDEPVLAAVREMIPTDGTVLVILDSDHSRENVAAELSAYAPMVTLGSYLLVEDTNICGHPVLPDAPAGPMEALRDFLTTHHDFVVDDTREKFMLTFNPSGYLRRVRR